jgi:hypothetical protein
MTASMDETSHVNLARAAVNGTDMTRAAPVSEVHAHAELIRARRDEVRPAE